MGIIIPKVLGALLKPPAFNLLLALAAFVLRRRAPRFSLTLLFVALVGLYALSLSSVAGLLAQTLERYPALDLEHPIPTDVGAIVVLGGGTQRRAREYGGLDTVSTISLVRLRYAAHLARRTGLPIALSGGTVFGEGESEAAIADRVLREDFGLRARWLEDRSRTTAENAVFSRRMLEAAGVERALLVTHAVHMRRAVEAFERAGLAVIPAPTGFFSGSGNGPSTAPAIFYWLPHAGAMRISSYVVHEWLGVAWYAIRD